MDTISHAKNLYYFTFFILIIFFAYFGGNKVPRIDVPKKAKKFVLY